MTGEPVRNKRQMYSLLAAGAFGNTIPQYFDLEGWQSDIRTHGYFWWGVRTLTPGGPCRLYCPRSEVPEVCRAFLGMGHRCNISLMIDAICEITLWADVYDSPTGLQVYGIEYPDHGASWRAWMPSRGKQYRGLAAQMILRKHLNESSLADLESLRDRWPWHVYELSACNRPVGVIPGRNAVVWEVRSY